jgi:hypothetical protein
VALYSVDPRCGLLKRSYERSPVVTLETDAASASAIPSAVRAAADYVILGELQGLRDRKVPTGADGVLTWLAGDALIQGSPANIRNDLRSSGRRSFVPVHLPCLEEVPFVTIQPRWFRSGQTHDYWNFNVRVHSPAFASPQALDALNATDQPWARLATSVLAEGAKSGNGVAPLISLWESHERLPAMIAALVVRNLFVLMLKHGEIAKAQQFLALGINSYSGYAELSYLAALLAVREQRFAQALPFLQKAKSRESGFLGSGGESSYRAAWLLGFLAARVGNHRVAFGHFLTGLNSTPVFLPAVEELLNLRLPPRTIEAHQYDFCRAVRREPRLLDKVFAYLLLHRAFEAAQRIARTIPMVDQQRAQLEDQLAAASAPFHGAANSQSAKTGVVLSGPFFEHTSLARSIAKLPAACFIRNIPQAPGASTCASSLRRHASSRRKCSQAAIYWSSRCFAIRRDLISPSATSGRPTCAAHHGESWR